MMRRLVAIGLVGLAFGVGAADEEPGWLKEARAKEGKLIEAQEVRSSDGSLVARLPVKLAAPITQDEQEYVLMLDLGAETPADCEVLVGDTDLAGLLRETASLSFQSDEAKKNKVEQAAIERIDAGSFGPRPFIAANWLYRMPAPDGMRLGSLKQIAVALPGYGIYCSHDSIGYEQTFRTAVHALAETLTMRNAEAESRYLELQVARVGDMRVGVSMLELAEDEDGDTRMRMRMSLLLPTGEASLSAMDSLTFQWTNPAGELLNSGEVSIENGEVDTDLDVQPDESGQWIVKGKFKGKDLEAKIGAERPQSLVAQAKARRALLAGPKPIGGELHDKVWTSVNPGQLMDNGFKVVGRDASGAYSATESLGPMTIEMLVDPTTGLPRQTSWGIGAQTLVTERIFVRGAP